MLSFGIAAAFPLLVHAYLWQVLEKYKVPRHIINIIKGLYTKHATHIKFAGRVYEGFDITAGIKQGCPSSGTLFAMAIDPFIRMLCL